MFLKLAEMEAVAKGRQKVLLKEQQTTENEKEQECQRWRRHQTAHSSEQLSVHL